MLNVNMEYMALVFILFSFLMDSGGDFGLRLVGLTVMSILIFKNLIKGKFFKKIIINHEATALYFVMCLSFFPGLIVSFINGVDIFDSVKWFVSFYFAILILILFLDFEIKKIIDATILAGVFYGLAQLIILLLLFVDSELVLSATGYLQSNARGWIVFKDTFGVTHPYVYLQSTLSIVPIAVLALHHGKLNSFFFLALILMLAQSRFGIFILVIFSCSFYLKSRVIDLMFISLVYCIPLFMLLLVFYVVAADYNPMLYIETSGMDVRVGHLLSIAKNEDALKILFGFGPGSLYFTVGVDDFVDNIEVSQLEYIRKYGIVGLIMFFPPLYFLLKKLYSDKGSRLLVMSICSMFFVALSNPVLISMTFSWLLAAVLYSLYENSDNEVAMQSLL